MEFVNGVKLDYRKKMAKRLSDTDKFKKPFFRSLPGPYKLLWDYLYHNCDNAGVWIKDFDIAQIYIGSDMKITEAQALKLFEGRIQIFDNGAKWFIPSFIEFQYDCTIENLNPKNNAHLSVIKKLTKEGLIRASRAPLDKDIDKDKDKDKDMDMDKYITVENKKVYDVIPILEYYEAPLNGRQKEHGLRNWRDVASEWFDQNVKLDFNSSKHVFNTFSKYLIYQGKPPNGNLKSKNEFTINDLK